MKKSDLILALCQKEGLKETEAFAAVNRIFAGFTGALKKGERIEIRGFGSFSVRAYRPYLGKNPKTGQGVKVGPKKLPYFKVGKELKERVNAGKASVPIATARSRRPAPVPPVRQSRSSQGRTTTTAPARKSARCRARAGRTRGATPK